MNDKLVAGSVLTGLSLLSAVLNAWAGHFFFTMFRIAQGVKLGSTSSFDPGPYGNSPEATELFIGLRVLLWVAILLGLALLVWGILEERAESTGL